MDQDGSTTPAVPATGRRTAPAVARAGLAKTGTATLAVLERVVPIAARLVRVLDVYSWIVVGAAVVIAAIVAGVTRPVTVGSVVPYLVLLVVLAIPCVALRLFQAAVVEVLAMPEWLRSSPDLVRTHGTELAQLAGEAALRSRDRLSSVPRDIFRSGRLLMKAHGALPEYGRMIRLINVPFLIVVLTSFLAGFPIIFFAIVFLVALPFTLIF